MYAPLFSVESQYLGAENTNTARQKPEEHNHQPATGLTRYAPPVVLHLVPVHAHLVAPNHRLQPVPLAEPLGDVGPELHADSALAGAPAGLVLRVGPQHLHHQPGLARLPLVVPVQLPDVVQRDGVVREETAVEDEVLGSDEGGEGQSRETLREELEDPAASCLETRRN